MSEAYGHYYMPDGEKCYGTLSNAKVKGAYPSATTVLDCIANENIQRKYVEKCVLKARDAERMTKDTDSKFIKRVLKAVEDTTATDFGEMIHREIETSQPNHPAARAVCQWLEENTDYTIAIEQTAIHPTLKYGGRIDRIVKRSGVDRPCIIDFKTQNVTGQEAVFWPNYKLQGSAYREAFNTELDFGSIVIDKSPPADGGKWRIFVKFYEREEIDLAFKAFCGALDVWKYTNAYYPQ